MFDLAPPSSERTGSTFVWSPTVRRILGKNFVTHHPELARRLDGVMADWFATHDAPASSLTHAARAGRWDLVVSLFRNHSTAVLETNWGEFIPALATAPEEVFADNPAAVALKTMAFHLPIDPRSTPVPRELDGAELTAIGRLPRAREELQSQLWQLLLYRTRHRYELAAVASDNAQAILQEAMVTRGPEVVGLQSVITANSGLLQLLLGNFRTAIAEFSKSYEFASLSEVSFSAANAAGKIALTYAMLGDESNASVWLRREVVAPVPQIPVAHYVRSAGLIARALAASVALRADQCASAIDALKQKDNHEELWPFTAYARKRQALLWGDKQNALDELESLGDPPSVPNDSSRWGGATAWLFPAAKAELLMALGRGNHANSVLDGVHSHHPLLDLARARLALLAGDNERAISGLNAIVEWHPGRKPTSTPRSNQISSLDAPRGWQLSSPGQRLETLIIGGVAHFRLGATEVAADMLERAVNQAHRLGSLLPFVRVPRQDLSALAAFVPSLERLLDQEPLASTPDVYPATVDLVTLTERETVILEGIAAGQSLRQIAAMNYVSTNTIKTQTQVLYRKLHANSRRDALLAASTLQLFEPGRPGQDAPPLAALP